VTESFRLLLRRQTLVQRVEIAADAFVIRLYDAPGRALAEATPPTPVEVPADSNVEMSWLVFGGEQHELYLALLKARCVRDGLDTGDETLMRQFRLHLHRGIGYLAAPNRIRGIADLVATAVQA